MKREGGHGFNMKEANKQLQSCPNQQQVRDCTRKAMESNKPSDADKRARFQARCDAKQSCQNALGAQCQARLDSLKQATCECHQQERQQAPQVRSTVPSCSGVTENQEHQRQGGQQQQQSCPPKDYCKLGYDAFEADQKSRFGGKNGGGRN